MSGLEALCGGFVRRGVRHVFGLPGTQNAELFTALRRAGVRPVLATHELAASFMAIGYARVTGAPAVLATIPGPGFAFALPGLAEARLDSVPIVHVVGTPARGPHRFKHQEIDQAAIAASLVKRVIEVGSAADVAPAFDEAWRLAASGEPGPVLLHVAPEALSGRVPEGATSDRPPDAPAGAGREAAAAGAAALADLLGAAVRPVLFVGGGAARASEEIRRLAEALRAPTFSTLSGRGVLPEDHPLALGFDANRGNLEALQRLLGRSDLILVLGCKLSHNGMAGFRLALPEDRTVQVNTDPEALGHDYPARLCLEARVEDVMATLEPRLAALPASAWTEAEVAEARAAIRAPSRRMDEPRFEDVDGRRPEDFFRALRAALPHDAIVVTDSGLHQATTRRHLDVLAPNGLVTPADFQSMAFGLPAALGAALAAPDRPVVAIVGDGGFLMSAMDLLCAVRERIPVTVVVFNDGYLNLIRVQQLAADGAEAAVSLGHPDFEAVATGLGARYARARGDPTELLREAVGSGQVTLIDVRLGDSPGMRTLRGAGLARAAARRALGPRWVERLKRLLGRR